MLAADTEDFPWICRRCGQREVLMLTEGVMCPECGWSASYAGILRSVEVQHELKWVDRAMQSVGRTIQESLIITRGEPDGSPQNVQKYLKSVLPMQIPETITALKELVAFAESEQTASLLSKRLNDTEPKSSEEHGRIISNTLSDANKADATEETGELSRVLLDAIVKLAEQMRQRES